MAAKHPPHESWRRAGDAGTIRPEDSREKPRGGDEHPRAESREKHLKGTFFNYIFFACCSWEYSVKERKTREVRSVFLFFTVVVFSDNLGTSFN